MDRNTNKRFNTCIQAEIVKLIITDTSQANSLYSLRQ